MPKLIIYKIGEYLSLKDLYNLMLCHSKFDNFYTNENFWLYKLKCDFSYKEDNISYKNLYRDIYYKKKSIVYLCRMNAHYTHFYIGPTNLKLTIKIGFPNNKYVIPCLQEIHNIYKNDLELVIKKQAHITSLPADFEINSVESLYVVENSDVDFYIPVAEYFKRYSANWHKPI